MASKEERGISGNQKDWFYGLAILAGWVGTAFLLDLFLFGGR